MKENKKENINKTNANEKNIEENKKKPKARKRTIFVLAIIAIAFLVTFIYLRGSYLEVKQIGENYLPSFWKDITYTGITFVINFAFLFGVFFFTNRTMQKALKIFFDDEKKEMPKFPNKSICLIIALIGSFATTKILLNSILLCFSNSKFGLADKVFNLDISYFMFVRPLINTIIIYLLVVVVATIIYTVIYSLIVLNKSFEGVDRESIRKCDIIGKVGSRVKLIAILLGLMIIFGMVQNIGNEKFLSIELSDAAEYQLYGAGVSDVTVKLWGYVILGVLTVYSIFRAYKSLREKSTRRVLGNLLIVPVYLVMLAVTLAGYQLIFVGSNELDKNQKYIEENIKQTKIAYGINISEENVPYSGTISDNEIEKYKNVINNIGIVSSSNVLQDLESSQTAKGYYTFRNTQIQNYEINNLPTLVYVTPREISNKNTTYSNKTYDSWIWFCYNKCWKNR